MSISTVVSVQIRQTHQIPNLRPPSEKRRRIGCTVFPLGSRVRGNDGMFCKGLTEGSGYTSCGRVGLFAMIFCEGEDSGEASGNLLLRRTAGFRRSWE